MVEATAPEALPGPLELGAAVVLVRHGQTDANLPPQRFQGRTDTALNETGLAQARALAEGVGPELGFRALWSSDLRRARETAEIVGERLGLEVRLEPRLAESWRGRWEGRLIDEVAAAEPELYAAWRRPDPDFRFPDGESLAEHAERARAALAELLAGPLPALAICHGGTIRCLTAPSLSHFHEPEVPNCRAFALDRDGSPLPR